MISRITGQDVAEGDVVWVYHDCRMDQWTPVTRCIVARTYYNGSASLHEPSRGNNPRQRIKLYGDGRVQGGGCAVRGDHHD